MLNEAWKFGDSLGAPPFRVRCEGWDAAPRMLWADYNPRMNSGLRAPLHLRDREGPRPRTSPGPG
jgi:hypothetical protein